jgi:hypothetical protein
LDVRKATLHAAANTDEYVRTPHGKWFAGRTWLAFCARDASVSGFIAWGRPDERDVPAFLRILEMKNAPLAEPGPRYVDLRGLQAPHVSTFAAIASHLAAHVSEMKRAVTRAAVVHVGGMDGALAAGIVHVAPILFPLRLFTDRDEGWRWLSIPGGMALRDELDELQQEVAGAQLVLGPEGRWFRLSSGPTVTLGRVHAVRLLLLALVRAHLAAPGRAVSVDTLFECGWPKQHIRSDVAAQRVYVALSTLRNLGLRAVLTRQDDGYLLRTDVCVKFEPDPA